MSLVEMHSGGSKGTEGSSAQKESPKQQRADLVRGKGKGLIILLHGVPGVGKTSTAECVAESTNRPLYSLTCGKYNSGGGAQIN
jgi:SpoVK/Ycf46/Vps4 family AAA+-type ATPase